jgi:hypothetical protein
MFTETDVLFSCGRKTFPGGFKSDGNAAPIANSVFFFINSLLE